MARISKAIKGQMLNLYLEDLISIFINDRLNINCNQVFEARNLLYVIVETRFAHLTSHNLQEKLLWLLVE